MKKVTLATIKSFILKSNNLHIKNISSFSGMSDMVEQLDNPSFRPATFETNFQNNNRDNQLGVKGAWFVFGSRDYFREYDDGEFIGYEVYNCCGKFILATPKHITVRPFENKGDVLNTLGYTL
jgi:hypothetical protein